ncbi:cytochrome P450 monooxygenase pc-3 [Pholiota conissans]|uniref:Cytochrome P450 monooxygenase pc-3 n=1 Tax=Pholiota conissans TaxID=109636 RepID=A0A9P6CR86_9AGAR|nr:cytochrome P450 monooxygenase pc-3 [Pholiota conissans]
MELPPGIVYFINAFTAYFFPSVLVYIFLTLVAGHQSYFNDVPRWLIISAAIVSQPLRVAPSFVYTKLRSGRVAKALGAVIPPVVEEWSIFTVSKLAATLRDGYPGDVLHKFTLKYGNTYQLEMLNQIIVVTLEPEHIKAILSTQFESFEKGLVFYGQMGSLLGKGVFNSDGEMWKFHRAMTRPFFTRERISDFEIYHRNCDISLSHAKHRIAEGHPVDFQDLVSRFTLDSATEFLFGNNVGSLLAGIPYAHSHAGKNPSSFYAHPSTAFVKAFTEGQLNSVCRMNYGNEWPLWEFWKDEVKPQRRIIDAFAEPLLRKALEMREKETSGGGDESKDEEDVTLLAHLVRHTQDPNILKDELVNLLVAGRDTTGSLLTSSFYMLTQHPDIEKRLREEVIDEVGPSSSPTYENMREMKYLRAFLNEVLRLYPPVPADTRSTKNATTLPPASPGQKAVYVPANVPVVYSIMHMQRRTDLWGPDALQFDPDRFIDERLHKYLVPNPFIFCPFNAGPRICLGQQFAYHEATYFLVRFLQQFANFSLDDAANVKPPADWANEEGLKAMEKIHPLAHLTMYVKGGLWVRMEELKLSDA